MKDTTEQYIQDFDEILQKLSDIWSQFLIYGLRLFPAKTYTNFVTMDHFLLDF